MSLVELLVELLAVLPVVLQQVATAGPVVAAILLAATITFIMSSITWCIDPGSADAIWEINLRSCKAARNVKALNCENTPFPKRLNVLRTRHH